MNKKCFVVIFNKTLQRLVVTSELAKSADKSSRISPSMTLSLASLKPLTFSLFCALGFVFYSPQSSAELIIQADKSSPANQQPIILKTANGLPQINIQTPNAHGLSHNKYSKFDVDTKGAILNNSRTEVKTEQAGMITGNPYLARGEAKVILNEVNASDPSILKGYVEVAGKKAEVIIANPSGIHCEGCGVINSARTTFTTGKTKIVDGRVTGFEVEQGHVNISGKGLDNSRVDYTEILSHSAEVNAGIWSDKKLTVVTGKNHIQRDEYNADNLTITHLNAPKKQAQNSPLFALDVSHLGGMYAGKIHLIGTEDGLGVRNAGHIGAAEGDIVLDSKGNIKNTGRINAHQQIQVRSTKSLDNAGQIESQQKDIRLQSGADIQQHGKIVARSGNVELTASNDIVQQGQTLANKNIDYHAQHISTTANSVLAAGVNFADDKQTSLSLQKTQTNGKKLHIQSKKSTQLAGKQVTSGSFDINATDIQLNQTQTYANDITLKATQGNIEISGSTINAQDKLAIHTTATLATPSSQLSANKIQTKQNALETPNAKWRQTGDEDFKLEAAYINNKEGSFITAGNFLIDTQKLDNHLGKLVAGGKFNISTANGHLINSNGVIFATKDSHIQSGKLDNNQGRIQSENNLSINTHTQELNNQQGKIIALENMTLTSKHIDNRAGFIQSQGNVDIQSDKLNNSATSAEGSLIEAQKKLTLEIPFIDNQHTKAKNEQPTQGIIAKEFSVTGEEFINQLGGVYSLKNAQFNLTKQINNAQGEILSWGDLSLSGPQNIFHINNSEGILQSVDRLSLSAQSFTEDGHIEGGDISINVQSDVNTKRDINAKRRLTLTTTGNITNNQKLSANELIQLNAHQLINQAQGKISAATAQLNIKSAVQNEGLINSFNEGGNSLTLIKAKDIQNIGTGRIYGDHLALQADRILNQDKKATDGTVSAATIAARQRLDLAAKEIINHTQEYDENRKSGALIYSEGDIAIGDSLDDNNQAIGRALHLKNLSSIIEAGKNILLNVQNIDNRNIHYKSEIQETSNVALNKSYILPENRASGSEPYNNGKLPYIDTNELQKAYFSRSWKYYRKYDPSLLQPITDIAQIKPNTLLASPNTVSCHNGNCNMLEASIYKKDNPIWQYFSIPAPVQDMPEITPEMAEALSRYQSEGLDNLTPSTLTEAEIEALDNANEAALNNIVLPPAPIEPKRENYKNAWLYNNAMKKYQQELAQYNKAVQRQKDSITLTPLLRWNTENGDKLKALDEAIEKHNRPLLGEEFVRFWQLFVNRKRVEESITTASLPSQILAGGNLTYNSENFLNDKSWIIAGQDLTGISRHLQNRDDEEALRRDIEEGYRDFTYSKWRGGLKRYHERRYSAGGALRRVDEKHKDMGIFVALEHTPLANQPGYLQGYARNNISTLKNQVEHRDAGDLTLGKGFNAIATANKEIEVRTTPVDTRLPTQSLYRINPNANSHVLIETDPAFANRKKWLSSDYMYNALRHNHENVHKRLGDGYYEQRLVREQINQLTGRQFLGNYSDFESQFKGLMDAGVSFAKRFNLTLGVSLSAEQVASLSTDIVWLEKQMVTLADGSQSAVMVPKVYAVVKPGDLNANGTLVSANNLQLKTNELINQGSIAGRQLVQFNSHNVKNTGKVTGDIIAAQVTNKVDNIGGSLVAENAILLDIEGDFNHESTTRTTNVDIAGYKRKQTHLDRKALLYVKGENGKLQISANNINLKGAEIINEGEALTAIHAKNALNVSTTAVGFEENMGGGDHHRQESRHDIEISHIKGKGDVVLAATQLKAEAAQLESGKKLTALAENNLVLKGASRTGELAEHHKYKSGSAISKKTKTTDSYQAFENQQGTEINAQEVNLVAGQDIRLAGIHVKAEKDIYLQGNGHIHLEEIVNKKQSHYREETKKSGFMLEKSAGSMRVGFGVSRAKDKDNHQSTQVVSSQLQSLAGNINVVSQKGDVSGNAAILDAGKDIYLQGKNIALKAATETQIKEHQSALKSASMGIGMTYKPKATFKQAYGEQEGQGSAGSAVGKVITAGEALDKTSHKVTQQFAPYVSAKASQSTHQEQHNNAVVSQLNAGGKLSLIATEGNLSTEGALLSAKEDGTLWAKQDIDLGVALSTQSQSAKGTRIGFDFDASRRPTDVVGKYLGKEQGEGESEKQHASVLSFGGKGTITAKEGNLTLLGSQVVANDNVSLSAGKNIRLATAVDSIAQGDSNTFHGMGEAVVSETERFSGYNRKLGNQEGKQTTHTGASIASLKNNVDIYAGKDLHQTSAQVLAKNRINISAGNVVADTAYNSTSHNSHQSDLKVGMFARVISPIIDLVNSVEKSVKDKEASDRVKAAQLMGLAAQGYNLNHALNHDDKAVLFRAEVGFGVAHSRQRQTGENQESIGNQLNAKEINVEARHGNLMAMQTDFTARDEKGEQQAGSQITLKAKEQLILEAGKDEQKQKARGQNAGVEVGTAISVGAQTGWSVYGQVGFGNQKQDMESTRYHNSHLESEHIRLSSGKDMLLKGALAKANRIEVESGSELRIESLQDEHHARQQGTGVGIKLEFGFGSSWNLSGYANGERGKSNSKQVKEQSGLFAKEGGYHISADNVHLKGGVIASTNAKNSELTTNKLTFEDIQNSSSHSATSGSISGSYGKEADYHVDNETGEKVSGTYAKNNPNSTTKIVPKAGPKFNPALPMHEQGEDSTTTKATLTEGKITLNKDSQPTETTAKALGINTDLSQANRQVEQPKDVNQLLKEQKTITEAVGHIATAATNFSHRQAKDLEEEAKEAEKAGDYQTAKAKREEAKSWETGGKNKRKVDAITTALSLALAGQSPKAIATGAASPYINQAIKNITEEIPELNIPAHILWGAIEAELTGGKAATGAIAAGVGELSAPILSQALYGDKKTNELTDAEKQQVLNLSKLVAGIASGLTATGNSAENLVTISQGMKIAENAVENNALNASQSVDYLKELSDAIAQGKSLDEINEKYKSISQAEFEKDLQACNQQGLMCYVGTLMAMDAGIKSAEGYKNFYPLPPDIQAQALDFVRNEAARHSIELVDGSPTMIQLALMAIEVGQEMYEAKNAGRSFAADRAQANFAKKVKHNQLPTKSSALPVPTPRKSSVNGETYTSNAKHTLGQAARSDPNAGIEPRNSFELFEQSKVSGRQRFTIDDKGAVHRFMNNNTAEGWHWAGSTSDKRNPLALTNKQKAELQKIYPEHKKNPNLN
ncbi:hemagglutinin repeat-containing protein [Haemophilus haemoglobinophilus]|nr:hemagglutinin repeat-containing protein [Canicola haemoglobinophilus]